MRQFFFWTTLVLSSCSAKKEATEATTDSNDTTAIVQPKADSSSPATEGLKKEITRFNDYDSYRQLDSYLMDVDLDTAEFQEIDMTCAIIIFPTERQIELMEKEDGESFSTIADDSNFYLSQASDLLDSLDINTIMANDKRYLKLIDGNEKEWTLDIRQKGAPGWNLIFFSIDKKPKVVSAIDVDSDLILDYYGSQKN